MEEKSLLAEALLRGATIRLILVEILVAGVVRTEILKQTEKMILL